MLTSDVIGHTQLYSIFVTMSGLMVRHPAYNVDYTYNLNMNRFSILDHFILSSALYNECISEVSIFHDVDNLSDHEPILLQLKIDVKSIALRSRVFTPRVLWAKASDNDINNYRSALSQNLKLIELPAAALLCSDMRCTDASHSQTLYQYAEMVTGACRSAAESNIPTPVAD
jgi:hypothetical protein